MEKKGNFLHPRRAALFWLRPGTRWPVRLGGPIITPTALSSSKAPPELQRHSNFRCLPFLLPSTSSFTSFTHLATPNGSIRRSSPAPCENGVSERHPLGCRRQRHRTAAVAACPVSSLKLRRAWSALLTDAASPLLEELSRGPARKFCTSTPTSTMAAPRQHSAC